MNTALVTHAWLECPIPGYQGRGGSCRRVKRWIRHYKDCWPTFILDNGSNSAFKWPHSVFVHRLHPHYKRGSMLDYPAVWRAYWSIKDLLTKYDRIFYIATDARVLSQRLMDYLEAFDSGWLALWSPKYRFPEPCIQVITSGCKPFEEFFAGECDPFKYNGQVEETTLPFTHVEKGFVGDRYSEYHENDGPIPPISEMDYYAQVPDAFEFDDSQFPVVRRVNGKVEVIGDARTATAGDAMPQGSR